MVLLVSSLVGGGLAEISMRVFGGKWFRGQLRQLRTFLPAFRAAIGDDERQEMLLRSGSMTLKFSLTVLALLVVLAAIAVLGPWIFEWSESDRTIYIVSTSVVAAVWCILKRPGHRNAGLSQSSRSGGYAYGVLERWLHWLALEPAAVRHLAFDLERQFALPAPLASSTSKVINPSDGAVYICGLARSGTTTLLHIIDEIDDFRSLTYRTMPFALAPNLWKQITQYLPRPSVPKERAHGDGIHVDFDSPEGFEEVFWRTFSPRTAQSCCFSGNEPSREVLAAFSDYRAIVANPRTEAVSANDKLRRYLSKNNNNLLRLRSLASDPAATVLLVYRNPIATARSLHRQHQYFCVAQTGDRFTRSYMGWLAHHEFGLDHLPFCFAKSGMDASRTPEDLNYWLDYWNAVYCYVLAQDDLRFYLVNHDALCAEPSGTLKAILAVLGVEADALALSQRIVAPKIESGEGFCPELLQRAETTHRALLDSPKNIRRA